MSKHRVSVALAVVAALAVASSVAYAVKRQVPTRAVDAAPELVGSEWLNTKDGQPVTLQSRLGKPTLVAFWTFACSNCQANMPVYKRILAKYRPKGVEMVSVHTPEMSFERDVDQVKSHITKFGIDYPVLIDEHNVNWNRWHVRYWPSLGVLDAKGKIVAYWEGELNWQGADGEAQVGRVLDKLLSGQS